MKRKHIEPNVKIEAVQKYLDGQVTQTEISNQLGVALASFQTWIRKYKSMGAEAFTQEKYLHYSQELREAAVKDYLTGQGSLQSICRKHKIMSATLLRRWVLQYKGDYDDTPNKPEIERASSSARGRRTNFDERLEIVRYCLAHERNYSLAAKKYDVSYQQARSYTLKYVTGGADALHDMRGRAKTDK